MALEILASSSFHGYLIHSTSLLAIILVSLTTDLLHLIQVISLLAENPSANHPSPSGESQFKYNRQGLALTPFPVHPCSCQAKSAEPLRKAQAFSQL